MTTTVNNNENKVTVNRIGFSGLFSKFFKEDTQVYDYLFEGGKCYSFAYYIGLNDDCKNGHLTFSFTGEIKVKKRNGRFYTYISGAIADAIAYFKPELEKFNRLHGFNHLGQPMFIDDIRFHINEGKTNEQIAEMYNISNLEAIFKAIIDPVEPETIPHISPTTSLQKLDTLSAFFLNRTATSAPFTRLEFIE